MNLTFKHRHRRNNLKLKIGQIVLQIILIALSQFRLTKPILKRKIHNSYMTTYGPPAACKYAREQCWKLVWGTMSETKKSEGEQKSLTCRKNSETEITVDRTYCHGQQKMDQISYNEDPEHSEEAWVDHSYTASVI